MSRFSVKYSSGELNISVPFWDGANSYWLIHTDRQIWRDKGDLKSSKFKFISGQLFRCTVYPLSDPKDWYVGTISV